MRNCRVTTEYQRKGLDLVVLENGLLRVEVLAGKGGDITEIRDKRTDINVLFETPHEWRPPGEGAAGAPDDHFRFLDHYPGGWQDVLPGAGGPATVHGAPLSLHGEATLVPWDVTIVEDGSEKVAVSLKTSLTRYPLEITRKIGLEAGQSTLSVEESVINRGEVSVDYSWMQHIALGEPLIAPSATVSVPCETVLVDPDHDHPNARLPAGETFEWPICDIDDRGVNLRTSPQRKYRCGPAPDGFCYMSSNPYLSHERTGSHLRPARAVRLRASGRPHRNNWAVQKSPSRDCRMDCL